MVDHDPPYKAASLGETALESPEETRPEPKTWWTNPAFLTLAGGLVLGTIFGVIFAIVTIILPINALQKRHQTISPFLKEFDPIALARKAGPPRPGWTMTGREWNQSSINPERDGVWLRQFRIRTSGLSAGEQASFVDDVTQALRQSMQRVVGKAPLSFEGESERSGESNFALSTIGYRAFEKDGIIQVWGVGHGTEMDVVISVQEH